MRLRPQIHRERLREQIRIVGPAAHDLRRQRRGGPGVHDVGIADEAARLPALIGRDSRPARRSTDRSAADLRAAMIGRSYSTRPSAVDGIPDRKRHAEEPLPADAPVAVQAVGPVLVPRLHVRRVPLQLAAAREQRLAELDRLDEPLPAGDDLERPIALLVELHRVRDRPRLADQVAGLAQLLDDLRARLGRRQAGQLVVVAAARARRRSTPSPARPTRTGRSVPSAWMTARTGRLSSRHQVTSVMSPNVQIIAMPLPFFGIGQRMRPHRHAHAEERRDDVLAEQRLVPLVVGMRDERDAGRESARAASSRSRRGRR